MCILISGNRLSIAHLSEKNRSTISIHTKNKVIDIGRNLILWCQITQQKSYWKYMQSNGEFYGISTKHMHTDETKTKFFQ